MSKADWKSLHWGDLVTLQYGRALRNTPESGPVPVYGTNGQIGWTDRSLCGHPSVIVGRKGAYRGIHYSAVPFFVIDTAFYLEPSGDIPLDMRWAYYQLLMQDINGLDTGSAIPSTTRPAFYAMPVLVPPLVDQVRTSGLLGALDDKIELNLVTNETIQALGSAYLGQALLDDPIEVTIGDAFFVNPEQVRPGGLPDPLTYIDIGSVSRGTLNERITLAATAAPSRARRLVRQGDTIISTVRPGRGAFLFIDQPDPSLVVSTGFAVLRPKRWPPGVSYFAATNPSFIQNLDFNSTGAAYPAVPAGVFEGLGLLMPAEPLVKELEQLLDLLLRVFHANLRQNETLAELRDLLLPKLMSGEIWLKEADKAVTEAL